MCIASVSPFLVLRRIAGFQRRIEICDSSTSMPRPNCYQRSLPPRTPSPGNMHYFMGIGEEKPMCMSDL
jgi:hypothetical protein